MTDQDNNTNDDENHHHHHHHDSSDEEEMMCENGHRTSTKSTASDDDDDEGSDPVMVSPSTSPRVDGQVENVKNSEEEEDDDDEPEEQFEDSIEHVKDIDASNNRPVQSLPSSFVTAGLQRKASPYKLSSWIALSLTLDGRDKITKVLQYLSRLLGWWCLAGVGSKMLLKNYQRQHHSTRFTALYKALANSRKAFRLGRSITEAHKIASMGLVGLFCWHLKQHLNRLEGNTTSIDGDDDETAAKCRRSYVRRASSNIGLGPMSKDEEADEEEEDTDGDTRETPAKDRKRSSLTHSIGNMAYQNMYRPLLSQISTMISKKAIERPTVEWWMATGTAMKMLGLFGFWFGDNVNFLSSNGTFDNYNLNETDRLAKRKRWQTIAGERANQAYFFGAIAGLLTNGYAYYRFQRDHLSKAQQGYQHAMQDSNETDDENEDIALNKLKKVQEKQFSLFLALLKSCVDVTVFSNNPGVDLHEKWRGRKNHEGLHCLCGLISAGTVLYNNFPDA